MKLSKNSYWLTSGIYTILQRFSTIFLNFGGFYFLVRIYSKSEFGVWALFTTITALVEVARNGLIRNAQVRFLSSTDSLEHPAINTASLAINGLFSLLVALIIVICAPIFSAIWKAPELETMLYYYVLTIFALLPSSQLEYIQHSKGDFSGVFKANFVRYTMIFLYIVFGFYFGGDLSLLTLVNFQTFAALCGSLVAFACARKYLSFSSKLNKEWFYKIFHYGKFTFGTNISSMLNKNIDQAMIGSMLGTASVAVYAAAIKISTLIEAPTLSVASIVFPQSAKRMKEEGVAAVKYLYERSVGVLLAIIFPALVFTLIFPKYIILIIAGEEYLETVPILQVTILYSFFVPYLRQFGTVLDSIGKPKLNFYFVIGGACLNAIFNYFFISRYGVIGATYGTLSSFVIVFVLNQLILSRIIGVETKNTFLYAKKVYVDVFFLIMTKLKLIKPQPK